MNISLALRQIQNDADSLSHRLSPIFGWLCLMAVLLMTACSNTERPSNDFSNAVGIPVMEYTIGPSDVLSIAVRNHADMSTTVTVRPDGMITFPLLGEIYVVGQTPAGLQNSLGESLREYVNIQPQEVSIVVDEVHSYTVSVLGEVRDPGRFEFQSQITILDALAQAGGLTEFASRRNIMIIRPEQDGVRRIRFNYRDAATANQVYLFPGDTVMVP
jgi:polysaccharide export outer membrane protein